jgi:hypothetical protein
VRRHVRFGLAHGRHADRSRGCPSADALAVEGDHIEALRGSMGRDRGPKRSDGLARYRIVNEGQAPVAVVIVETKSAVRTNLSLRDQPIAERERLAPELLSLCPHDRKLRS